MTATDYVEAAPRKPAEIRISAIDRKLATMTVDEHDAWWGALPAHEYDKHADKTFRVVEWEVRIDIDEHGDSGDVRFFDDYADALKEFQEQPSGSGTVFERAVKHYNRIDRTLEDVDYDVVAYKGPRGALEAFGVDMPSA